MFCLGMGFLRFWEALLMVMTMMGWGFLPAWIALRADFIWASVSA